MEERIDEQDGIIDEFPDFLYDLPLKRSRIWILIKDMRFLRKGSFLKKILTVRVAYHFGFWAFFFILMLIPPEKEGVTLSMKAMTGLRIIILGLFPVYFHFFVLEKFFYRKKYVIYAALFISTMALYIYLFTSFSPFVFNGKIDYYSSAAFVFFIVLISTSLRVIKRSINERFLLQEIESKQVQTELELLKTQINPHFLFNTLNNLFGMARRQDKGTASGIAGLSHLMRYMIYESNVDRISLEKEIDQIKRLIDLQKLRFSLDDPITIDFRVEGDVKSVRIPPMLLIPFVENAFKHGLSLKTPSFIEIQLSAKENILRFSVRNSAHPKPTKEEEPVPGVGLQNVRRRLELLFPGNYELTVNDSREVFEVELILKNI